ncbi:MAG: sigma-70 family RNA polymerase sigma factor [Planctomycetia bacterium]|nr:sigma-70 family RNA polymerase sigma factor [Planctomycetia bacterium]
MSNRQLPEALIRAAQAPAEPPDGDLLERFVRERDSSAFEELVQRHGPMVMGVCRRSLGDTPDAEDAFQAVWLVLIRKARTISPQSMVGNWLYGVASRTALHARTKRAAQRAKHQELPDVTDFRSPDVEANETAAVIDAELAKLPDKYRAAVVLCELEGRSLKEVAEELDVPVGTVASRLARGRATLARRLLSRGFAPSLLGCWLTTAIAPVSAQLRGEVLAMAGAGFAASRSVSELAKAVLSALLAHKLKTAGRMLVRLA